MNWKKLILPPVAIYAVIFLFISALIGMKVVQFGQQVLWVWIVDLIITIVGLYIAVGIAKPKNTKEALIYGIVWVIVLFVLDLLLTLPFMNNYFSSWKAYIPYILTLLAPILLPKK